MSAKTSQLQIRVTEEQKAALKRLAAAANMTVSSYVLGQALPSRTEQLERVLTALREGKAGGLEELASCIGQASADDLAEIFDVISVEGLTPLLRNQVAAIAEQGAHAKGAPPPRWAAGVPGLVQPHFGWPLSSLRPHQIRVTPVAFKRRGIFFDPASRRAWTARPTGERRPGADGRLAEDSPPAVRRLAILDARLRALELKVECHLLGGALLLQVFRARPPTAHISALLEPLEAALKAVEDVTQRERWPAGWLHEAVKDRLVDGARFGPYVEWDHLAVFAPPPEYVLALCVVRLRLESEGRAIQDLRYVLRALNLTTAREALEIAERYFTPRQLPRDVEARLDRLLAG